MITVLSITCLALFFGAILGFASNKFKVAEDPIVDRIDTILPQTQCGQCGHPGCKPYAEAIAKGELHNKCPPGGETVIKELSELLNRDFVPLDDAHGSETQLPMVAVIREAECIGCTKCIQACPVDAILGAAKQMHTVINDECTGCDLCVEPCPVDCIDMVPLKTTDDTLSWSNPKGIVKNNALLIPLKIL